MKKIKVLMFLITSLVVLTFLTGCTNKTPITGDEFKVSMEENGYTIYETDDFSNIDSILGVYIAKKNDSQIEFYQMDSVDYAKDFYENNEGILETMTGSASFNSKINMANYSKCTFLYDDEYYIVSRIEDSVIYVSGTSDDKDEINKILEDLGY